MIRLILISIFLFSVSYTKPLVLTEKEKLWLKNHPIIKVGADNNFAPFEFVDENGVFKGVTADYLKEMQEYINIALNKKRKAEFNTTPHDKDEIRFDIVKDKKWSSILKMARGKELDLISCIVETQDRKKYLDFTSVYLTFPMVIVTNKATGFIHNLSDLKGRSVAVIDCYTPNELLKDEGIFLVVTETLSQALELVSSGKTFAHVGNLSRVTYALRQKGFQNLTVSGITDYKYNFSMATKKEDKILNNIMQKAFDSIPSEVKASIYYKWFPLEYEEEKDYALIWLILFGTLTLTLIFSFWVFRLNMNIKKRKVDKAQLLKDKSWLNNSLRILNNYAWQWDLEKREIKINPDFAKLLNLKEEETIISEKYFKSLIKKEDLSKLLADMEDHFSKKTNNFSTILTIETKAEFKKRVLFTGKIEKIDIFSHAKRIIGVVEEIKEN